jgi:hypothetical protein
MDKKEISAASIELRKKLTEEILKKTESIREKINLGVGSNNDSYLQMLIMVSEDLDDVLLNWEYESISATRFNHLSDDEFDDLEDDY